MWLFAWTAKRDEAHVERRQYEMPGSTTLTHRVHQEPTSQTRANPDHRPHTEALCCVAVTHWKPDYGPDIWGMALTRLAPDTPANTP